MTGCQDEAIHQMANLEPPGHDLITLHVYSPPPSCWNYYTLDVTTLADHDSCFTKGPRRSSSTSATSCRWLRWDHRSKSCRCPLPARSPVIAIVGGGFSGAMVAVHLARLAGPRPPRVVLFEKADRLARGVAYGTPAISTCSMSRPV